MTQNNISLSSSNDDKQAVILAYFRDYQSKHNRPPTLREVSEFLGSETPSVARHHLNRLVAEEKLVRRPSGARRYALPPAEPDVSDVLLDARNRVAAGEDAEEVLRRLTIQQLYGDDHAVFESIAGNLQITGEELSEYLSMPKKRVWAALDHLMELELIVREYDDFERQLVYRLPESE